MTASSVRVVDIGVAKGNALPPSVAAWLREMERCVRERDFAVGRGLFADGVVGFGTREPRAEGLDALERDQWRPTWTTTEGFRFDLGSARATVAGRLACVAVRWSSLGIGENGGRFERRGRATLVLDGVGGTPVCVHSHFSLDPTPVR